MKLLSSLSIVLYVVISFSLLSQTPKKQIYLTEIFETAIIGPKEDSVLEYIGYEVIDEHHIFDYLTTKFKNSNVLKWSEGRIVIDKEFYFEQCEFPRGLTLEKLDLISFTIWESSFKPEGMGRVLNLIECTFEDFGVNNSNLSSIDCFKSEFNEIFIGNNSIQGQFANVIFSDSKFYSPVHMFNDDWGESWIFDNCYFYGDEDSELCFVGGESKLFFVDDSLTYGRQTKSNNQLQLRISNSDPTRTTDLIITNSHFVSENKYSKIIIGGESIRDLVLTGNKFGPSLIPPSTGQMVLFLSGPKPTQQVEPTTPLQVQASF